MISRSLHIASIQLRKEILSAKNLCIFIIISIYLLCLMEPVNRFARDYNCKISPFGSVFIFSNISSQVVLAIGMVFIFCNAPYRDENYPYLVLRSGTKAWILGNAIYIVEMSGIYVILMVVTVILSSVGRNDFLNSWGKIWTTLARTDIGDDYLILFQISNSIRSNLKPIEALLISIILEWSSFSLIGLVVYLGNNITDGALGTLIGAFYSFYDLIIYNMLSNSYYKLSPVSLARLSLYYEVAGIKIGYSILMLVIASSCVSMLCYFAEKFRKSGGKV